MIWNICGHPFFFHSSMLLELLLLLGLGLASRSALAYYGLLLCNRSGLQDKILPQLGPMTLALPLPLPANLRPAPGDL